MKGAASIFRFLSDRAQLGERVALVTITDVIGSSSRAPGTHMAVSETGAWCGSFSGGCVEAAVVGEARRVIQNGKAEQLRLGAGSPYIDILLPCGGGIDLLIIPKPDRHVLDAALHALQARRSVQLTLGVDGALAVESGKREVAQGWHGAAFVVRHDPELKIIILGHGAETEALARLSLGYGAEVCVLSPDALIVEQVRQSGADVELLKGIGKSPHLHADCNTAIITLFHDHDWEIDLLAQAVEGDAFYVGAMGSRATHARRIDELAERGVTREAVTRIIGPVGLIPATRDPETLALSVLSQIVALHQQNRQSDRR